MPYLTYEEYQEYGQIEETEFKKLLPRATTILDSITSHFYVRNDIQKDNSWRVKQFKQALCSQIEYFHSVGSMTFEGINSAPQSFSAGRTTVSNGSRQNRKGAVENKPLVAEEVFISLEGTGLLFGGVALS